MMRIGLHSGEVTAGILRGQKSRFQLFGDSMNTGKKPSFACRQRSEIFITYVYQINDSPHTQCTFDTYSFTHGKQWHQRKDTRFGKYSDRVNCNGLFKLADTKRR